MAARKLIGLLLLASAVLAGPAAAQAPAQTPAQAPAQAPAEDDTKPVWHAHVDADGAAFSFATPDSDDSRFMVLCENKKRSINLTVYEEVKGMKVKRPLTIELSAGGKKASLKGVTATDEMNGYTYGEAHKVAADPLLAVLREPGELTVKMGKASATFPAEGRAEQLKIFEKGCKVK
jgi:hypothetical protein